MIEIFLRRAPSEGRAWCGGHPDPDAGRTEGTMPPLPRDVVLLGDMNFTHQSDEYELLIGPVAEGYGRPCNADGLVDAWVAAGHDEDVGVTYPDGKRIDDCFVSSSLRDRVESAWIDESAQGSDHWPLWIQLRAA